MFEAFYQARSPFNDFMFTLIGAYITLNYVLCPGFHSPLSCHPHTQMIRTHSSGASHPRNAPGWVRATCESFLVFRQHLCSPHPSIVKETGVPSMCVRGKLSFNDFFQVTCLFSTYTKEDILRCKWRVLYV